MLKEITTNNVEFCDKHIKQAAAFYAYAQKLLAGTEDRLFVDVAGTSSVYITVYADDAQSVERVYRFADHANCRRYTAAVNVAPQAGKLSEAKADVKELLAA